MLPRHEVVGGAEIGVAAGGDQPFDGVVVELWLAGSSFMISSQ
jgi:hypothetical protein